MKILQVVNTLSSGGAEVFVCALATALTKLGCKVQLFTYGGVLDNKGEDLAAALEKAGIVHRSLNIKNNLYKPIIPLFLAKHINQFQPQICHSHLEQSDFFLALADKLSRVNTLKVRTIHNVFARRMVTARIHEWLRYSFDSSVACGPAVRAEYPYFRSTDLTINNGIDLSALQPQIDRVAIRSQLNLHPTDKLFVHIGAFCLRNGRLQKSQDIIVSALPTTDRKDYAIAFLGEGNQRSLIENMAHELGVYSRCRFVGRVTNPADYIYAADAVLMPSRFEGLSVGCIEAVCSGRAVIASDIAAFSLFKRPSTLFVRPESTIDLAKAIDSVIRNLDAIKSAALEAKNSYRNAFDIDFVATRYFRHYADLVSK